MQSIIFVAYVVYGGFFFNLSIFFVGVFATMLSQISFNLIFSHRTSRPETIASKNQTVPENTKCSQVMTVTDLELDSNKPEMKSTEKSRAIITENNNETRRISYAEEWKVLSNVLNMLFFYVTLSVIIVGTSYIFTSFQSD